MILLNSVPIKPTIFPDKTSQVWQISETNPNLKYEAELRVTWEFENEAELIHLSQLKMLLDHLNPKALKVLSIPYLPYARQDKQVSDASTFALSPFARMLNTMEWDAVLVFDPHSSVDKLINKVVAIQPNKEIQRAITECKPDYIVFPDEGAWKRYRHLIDRQHICLEKKRDQLSGAILGLEIINHSPMQLMNKKCLMIDDLCDGGRTFTEAARLLWTQGAKEVDLYVSHGIFSKGLAPLREGGIKRIFTKDGELK